MQETIDTMASTQDNLISLMRALTEHNGIEVDETDGTFQRKRSASRPPSLVSRDRSLVHKSPSPAPESSEKKPVTSKESIDLSEIVQL